MRRSANTDDRTYRSTRSGLALFAQTILIFMMTAAAASAQAFTPPDAFALFGTEFGDSFTSVFLNQIFGPLFPSANGSTSVTVFSSVVGFFNIFVLVVGGMLLFYNITVGVLQSAHEGSVLGQRWSSLWAPLRTIFAVGLLVPIPSLGGYNLAQSGVAWTANGATNFASLVWRESASLVISGKIPITAPTASIEPGVIKTIYDNAVCVAVANQQFAIAAPASTAPLQVATTTSPGSIPSPYGSLAIPVDSVTVTSYVRDPSNPSAILERNICGSFSTPVLPAYIKNTTPDPTAAPTAGLVPGNSLATATAFQNAHVNAMNVLNSGFQTIIANNRNAMGSFGSAVPDLGNDIANVIRQANGVLTTGMADVIQAAAGSDMEGQASRDALLARINGTCSTSATATGSGGPNVATCYGEGWIGAGSWYMMLARMNGEIASLTRAQATAQSGNALDPATLFVQSGGDSGWFGMSAGSNAAAAGLMSQEETALLTARYTEAFERASSGMAALGFAMSDTDLRNLNSSTDAGSFFHAIPGYTYVTTGLINFVVSSTAPTNFGDDPIIGITEIGHWLINLAGVLTTISFAAGASAFGFSVPAGIATALQIPNAVLLGAGVTLSFVIPMTPFILWVMGVTGYFLLVVEAVIAVNLWALSHLRMDGDGISGEAGRQGWLMLLTLLMTPVLMIFGFLIGMTIFRVTTSLLDIGIHQAMSGIIGGSPFAIFAAVLVYSVMMSAAYLMIIERSFTMISDFPDRIMRWMGATVSIGADTGAAKGAIVGGAAAAASVGKVSSRGAFNAGQQSRGVWNQSYTNIGKGTDGGKGSSGNGGPQAGG